jgi:hypothetical protein
LDQWTDLGADGIQILGSEVRNNNWAGSIPVGGAGDLGSSQTKTIMDYVRVYAAIPEPATFILFGASACVLWRCCRHLDR